TQWVPWRIWAGVAALSALAYVWVAGGHSLAAPTVGAAKGDTAADFTLSDPDGKKVRLHDLKGKVVILSFWATWCPPCRMEMPHLEALAKKYAKKPVKVVGVNLDVSGAQLKSWMQKNKLGFTVVSDTDGAVANRYRVQSIPTLFLLDQNLVIQERKEGFDPDMEKNLGAQIDALLKKK
ncbi:MAG: TlpA disulfide reductase family protein, partial [Armatimonadota bacterium]|nr:TlpA disulfide reductase family protein [Armatimonadota bacterium]